MVPRRFHVPAAAVLVLAVLASSVLAEEYRNYEEDYSEARDLVRRRHWAEAVEAYRELFANHPGERRTLERLRDIEEDLKRCLFMRDWRKPNGKQLFGPAVTSFDERSRRLKLEYPRGPGGPHWAEAGDGQCFYGVRFDGSLTLEVGAWKATGAEAVPMILLCYSIEERGGYLVVPGVPPGYRIVGGRARRDATYIPVCIAKVEKGKRTFLLREMPAGANLPFRIRRDHTRITFSNGRDRVGSVRDRTFKGGYLGFANIQMADLEIRGTVDKVFYRQVVSEHENTAFREWLKSSYDRDRILPSWTRKRVEHAASDHDTRLPDDADPALRDRVGEAVGTILGSGDRKTTEAAARTLRREAAHAGELTRRYLTALAHLADGELARCRAALDACVADAPDFAPALAVRGLVHLDLRDTDRARADVTAALEADPELRLAYVVAVLLAVYDGDLAHAAELLAGAERHGLTDDRLREIGDVVHRAKRGPLWSIRHHAESIHFDVSSDHSKRLCSDVARQLEMAQWRYAKHFPGIEIPDRRARIRVFATPEGYHRYAAARRLDLSHTAGAYLSNLRELVLYLPVDRTELGHTIRHEGFHRFIHEYLEDVPIWFDEGYAEFFGSAEEDGDGGFTPGAPNRLRLGALAASRPALVPLEELFLMRREAFMKRAEICYAQAWLVVYALGRSDDGRGLLAKYFLALREGRSQREAYLSVLAPHREVIGRACRTELAALLGRRGR